MPSYNGIGEVKPSKNVEYFSQVISKQERNEGLLTDDSKYVYISPSKVMMESS